MSRRLCIVRRNENWVLYACVVAKKQETVKSVVSDDANTGWKPVPQEIPLRFLDPPDMT